MAASTFRHVGTFFILLTVVQLATCYKTAMLDSVGYTPTLGTMAVYDKWMYSISGTQIRQFDPETTQCSSVSTESYTSNIITATSITIGGTPYLVAAEPGKLHVIPILGGGAIDTAYAMVFPYTGSCLELAAKGTTIYGACQNEGIIYFEMANIAMGTVDSSGSFLRYRDIGSITVDKSSGMIFFLGDYATSTPSVSSLITKFSSATFFSDTNKLARIVACNGYVFAVGDNTFFGGLVYLLPARVITNPGNMLDVACQHGDTPGVAYGIGPSLAVFDGGIVDTVAHNGDEIIAVSDFIYTLNKLTGRCKLYGRITPVPTAIPTVVPTEVPTAVPTSILTAVPTSVPTAVPTAAPTAIPTAIPTSIPTAVPTAVPTSVPTAVPTAIPTAIPTAAPTSIPTAIPTAIPTSIPTAVPTAVPTAIPTAIPTAAPTAITDMPTAAPTAIPTAIPTAAPTSIPTAIPTAIPTSIPTAVPTAVPTAIPTAIPTAAPTAITDMPTSVPTAVPTTLPTLVPTAITTAVPALVLTVVPTTVPTAVPTANSTTMPSAVPTANPMAVPIIGPTTVVPTAVPTLVATSVRTSGATTAILTVVPSTKSPPGKIESEVIPPVQRKDPIARSSVVTASSSIAMAAGAMTTSGTNAVAIAHTVRRITCFVETDNEELDVFIHPLRFPVAGSYWAGAVVGGVVICFSVVLIHLGLHFIVEAYTGASQRKSVARKLRYPSAVIPPLLMCVVNVATCSVLLLKEGKLPGIAVLGVCCSIGITGVVVWLFKLDSSKCQFIKGTVPKSKLFIYFLGEAAWESTDINDSYVESNGMVFDAHTEQKWVRGHYFLLEFWMTIPVVLVLFIESCSVRGWVLFVVNALQVAMISKCWIYSSNFLAQLSVATCLSTCTLTACSLAGFGGELVLAPMLLILCVVRALYDIVCYILDVFYAVRELKLERDIAEDSNIELGVSMQQLLVSLSSLEQSRSSPTSFMTLRASTETPSELSNSRIISTASYRI